MKINDIEVLRCFSIIAVLLQHAANLFPYKVPIIEKIQHYLGGSFGVDLFFTISGFLVAQSLIKKLDSSNTFYEKKQVIINFWIRRMWRLWPAAWACLALTLICVIFFNESNAFGTLSANIDATIAGFFHFANLRFYNTFMQSEYGVSFVYWTLSLEEQFYFIFPILFLIIPRKIFSPILIACIIMQLSTIRYQNLLLIAFRTDAIMLGVLISYIHNSMIKGKISELIEKHKSFYYKILLISLIALMSLLSAAALLTKYKYSWLAIISFLLVFIASLNLNKFTPDSSLKNIALWFGKHSYSLYLTHIPVYYLTRELVFKLNKLELTRIDNTSIYIAIATLLIPLTAHCSYKYIENPLRIFSRKITYKNSRKDIHEYI